MRPPRPWAWHGKALGHEPWLQEERDLLFWALIWAAWAVIMLSGVK